MTRGAAGAAYWSTGTTLNCTAATSGGDLYGRRCVRLRHAHALAVLRYALLQVEYVDYLLSKPWPMSTNEYDELQ